MIRQFTLAKVSQSEGTYRFISSASDDRVDLKNTRLDRECFRSFIENVAAYGTPFENVAHYPDSKVGLIDQMWVDGHYLKLGGAFDGSDLAAAAVESLREDQKRPIRRIQQSVGFYPTDIGFEDDVLVYLCGWLEHCALTVIPVNPRTDIHLIMQSEVRTRFDDACEIVGHELATKLEQKNRARTARLTERTLYVPDIPLGMKADAIIGLLCGQVAAPLPIAVFSNAVYEPPSPRAVRPLSIDEDVRSWLESASGDYDIGSEPLLSLSRKMLSLSPLGLMELSDRDVVEQMSRKPSYAYLERLVSIFKEIVPEDKLADAYKLARGYAGGKGSPVYPTKVSAEDFEADPESAISDLTDSDRVPTLVRAMLAIIEANQRGDIPAARKRGNISQTIEEFKRKVLKETKSEIEESIVGELVGKPYPNEHACRLHEPSDFQPGSFRSMKRKHEDKEYRVLIGRLKGKDTTTEQGYRYPSDEWTAAEAKAHCKAHDGIEFAPATGEKKSGGDDMDIVLKGALPFQDLPLADEGMAWDARAADQRVRKWAGGPSKEDIDWGKYAKAFLWVDSENKENFTSYKLGYADIVDGGLKAVPKGVMAAAGVLQGARGGVDIPEADKDSIRNVLSKYYAKMDRTPPWKSEKSFGSSLLGMDKLKQIVYGVVLEPDVEDDDGLSASAEEIEMACHRFGASNRQIWVRHQSKAEQVHVLENYCAKQEESFEHPIYGRQIVPKGTWIMAVKIDDPNIWEAIEKSELIGFSLRALVDILEDRGEP